MKAEGLFFTLIAELLQKFHADYYKPAAKIASLHIYVVRSIYNIVSVCRSMDVKIVIYINPEIADSGCRYLALNYLKQL